MRSYFWVTLATMMAASASLADATSLKALNILDDPLLLAEVHSDSLAPAYSDADIEADLYGDLDSDSDSEGTSTEAKFTKDTETGCKKPPAAWIKVVDSVLNYHKCVAAKKKAAADKKKKEDFEKNKD